MLKIKRNRPYFYIFLLTIISFFKSYAQESVNVSGNTATGTGGSLSYSVGQITYISQFGTGGLLSLGVQQPYEIAPIRKDNFTEINLAMSAFPNPTTDFLKLVITDNQWNNLSYQLFEINGRALFNPRTITASETSVSMQELRAGMYFLAVNNEIKTIKTFKIIKK